MAKATFISHSSEAGNFKIKVLKDLVSDEGPLPDFTDGCLLTGSSQAEGARELSESLFFF